MGARWAQLMATAAHAESCCKRHSQRRRDGYTIFLTVRADNEIVGEYAGATEVDLAFRVAAACAKNRREVTVFDGECYLDSSGGKHSEPYIWPLPRPPGRPKLPPRDLPPRAPVGRPPLPGKVLRVRVSDAAYDALIELGNGCVANGINRALDIVSHSKA